MNVLYDPSTQTEIQQIPYCTKTSQSTQTTTDDLRVFSQDDTLLLGTDAFPNTGLNLEFDLSSPAPTNADLGFLNQIGNLQATSAEIPHAGFLDSLGPTTSAEIPHVAFINSLDTITIDSNDVEPIIIDSNDIFENISDNDIHFDDNLFEDDNTVCRYDKFASEIGTEEQASSNLKKAFSDSAFGSDICWTVCVFCKESYFDFYTVPCCFCKGGICDDCFYKSQYIQVVDNRLSSISVIEGGVLHPFARLYTVCSESCATELKSLIAD